MFAIELIYKADLNQSEAHMKAHVASAQDLPKRITATPDRTR